MGIVGGHAIIMAHHESFMMKLTEWRLGMTRKDYVALAEALGLALGKARNLVEREGEVFDAEVVVGWAIQAVSVALAKDNARFDGSRFDAAVVAHADAEAARVR